MSSGDSIEVDLQSTDYDTLKKSADDLVTELRKREDVMQVHSSVENAAPVIKGKSGSGQGGGRGTDPGKHRFGCIQQFKRCESGDDLPSTARIRM